MRFGVRTAGVAVIILAGGCATSRYSSRVIDDGYQSEVSHFRNRYEIKRFAFNKGYQPFYRQIGMGNGVEAKKFLSADMELKSDRSANPMPIAVDVSPVAETSDGGLLAFLNFLTLGMFPYSQEQSGKLKVTVSPMDSRMTFDRREFMVECVYKHRFTPFFGIWPFLPENEEWVYRTEFAGPSWNGHLANEVYFGSIGSGVSKVLSRIDANLAMQGETKDGEDNARKMSNASLPKETLEDKADKRSERMKDEKCTVCGSMKNAQGRCPLCSGGTH